MRNGENLRAVGFICLIDHSVGKAIKVIDPKAIFGMRPALLVLDQQISNTLVFGKEGQRDHRAGASGVIHSRIA